MGSLSSIAPSDIYDSAGVKPVNCRPSDSINLENLLSSSSSIIEFGAVVVVVVVVADIDVNGIVD